MVENWPRLDAPDTDADRGKPTPLVSQGGASEARFPEADGEHTLAQCYTRSIFDDVPRC
jgi:hypothetical protein